MKKLQLAILSASLAGAISAKAQDGAVPSETFNLQGTPYSYILTPSVGIGTISSPSYSLMENGSSALVTYNLDNTSGPGLDIWVCGLAAAPSFSSSAGDPDDETYFNGTLAPTPTLGNPATYIDVAPGTTVTVAQFLYTTQNPGPEFPVDSGLVGYFPPILDLATTSADTTPIGTWDGNLPPGSTSDNAEWVLVGFNIQVNDVPEPSTLVLLLTPLGAATLRMLRKNRTA